MGFLKFENKEQVLAPLSLSLQTRSPFKKEKIPYLIESIHFGHLISDRAYSNQTKIMW